MFLRFSWITNSSFFDVLKEGFQTLTIPKSGTYSFEVIGAGVSYAGLHGARINGKIRLERGEKITVALGQKGTRGYGSGSGATFVVKETGNRPESLFIAAGAGCSYSDSNYGRASLAQTANGNKKIGSSGVQKFQNGELEDFYCAGAGFLEAPNVGRLHKRSEPPQSYSQGLLGGKGYSYDGYELEGGFGGGGAAYDRYLNGQWKYYYGCGGGYTGGSSRIRDNQYCDGGGGGSFAADPNATFDHKSEQYGKCKIKFIS